MKYRTTEIEIETDDGTVVSIDAELSNITLRCDATVSLYSFGEVDEFLRLLTKAINTLTPQVFGEEE